MKKWHTVHLTTIDLTAYCFLRSWFAKLREQGHRVTLITTVERFRAPLEEVADEVFHIAIPRRIEPSKDLRALAQLTRKLAQLRPDFIHTHTAKAGLLGRLAALFVRTTRRGGGARILHTIHELPQNAAQSALTRNFYWLLEKVAATWADHLVTVSHVNARQILGEGICRPEKLSVIPNGLQLDSYRVQKSSAETRLAWDVPNDAWVMGTSARLEKAKGHTYLLAALPALLQRIPNLYWVCTAGTGQLKEQLEKEADRLGVSHRVRWVGWVEDLPSALNAFDIFVLPTLYEGQGVVLLEAMAMSKAVVCSRVGGTQDVLVDGETGLFVPPRQPHDLVEAVEALHRDPARAERMGRAGRLRVEKCFQANQTNEKLLELYQRLARP